MICSILSPKTTSPWSSVKIYIFGELKSNTVDSQNMAFACVPRLDAALGISTCVDAES